MGATGTLIGIFSKLKVVWSAVIVVSKLFNDHFSESNHLDNSWNNGIDCCNSPPVEELGERL